MLFLAAIMAAHAQTCDVKALNSALQAASPSGTPAAFAALAACDPKSAKAAAATAFPRVLPGPDAQTAVLAAIDVGAGDAVRAWMTPLMPDERAQVIAGLGRSCDKPKVPGFFVESQTHLGPRFWTDRWYAGLESCKAPEAVMLLQKRLDTSPDRASYLSVLEIYTNNAGVAAVPYIQKALSEEKDQDAAIALIQSLERATKGNPTAQAQAAGILRGLAPSFGERALSQTRTTLTELGAEEDADGLVGIRYKDRLQSNGTLLYGVVVVEKATCKNGKVKINVHQAMVTDPAKTWPDQLQERMDGLMKSRFSLKLAEGCKGEADNEVVTPPTPFKDAISYKNWTESQLAEIQKKYPDVKVHVIVEDNLTL